jgi:hypothetical protein
MRFLKPNKRKLLTTVLFVFIGLVLLVINDLTSKAYKEYVKNAYFSGELLDKYNEAIKQGPLAPGLQDNRIQEIVKKIPPEAHKKVELAGWFNVLFTAVVGVLIIYLGACISHREPKQRTTA